MENENIISCSQTHFDPDNRINSTYYAMQILKLLTSLLDETKRLNRKFFWGEEEHKRKIHPAAQGTICKERAEGALGMKNLRDYTSKAYLAAHAAPKSIMGKNPHIQKWLTYGAEEMVLKHISNLESHSLWWRSFKTG